MSDDLSRAIPQVLKYAEDIKNNTDTEKRRDIGLPQEGKIRVKKCIIVIGNENKISGKNSYLKDHFERLKSSFNSSLEIHTYSDLINKIEITIQNLKSNSATEEEAK